MAELSTLEYLLQDHQNADKSQFLDVAICLDKGLLQERALLDREIAAHERQVAADQRLGDTGDLPPDLQQRTDELDAKLDAVTMRLKFKAVTAPAYAKLLKKHGNVSAEDDPAGFDEWVLDLIRECYQGAWLGDEKQPVDFDTIYASLSWGEAEPIKVGVTALNQVSIDRPFSPTRSKGSPTG